MDVQDSVLSATQFSNVLFSVDYPILITTLQKHPKSSMITFWNYSLPLKILYLWRIWDTGVIWNFSQSLVVSFFHCHLCSHIAKRLFFACYVFPKYLSLLKAKVLLSKHLKNSPVSDIFCRIVFQKFLFSIFSHISFETFALSSVMVLYVISRLFLNLSSHLTLALKFECPHSFVKSKAFC